MLRMGLGVMDNQTELSECHRSEDMERITPEPAVALEKLVHLLIHRIFVECLLYARLCSRQ